MHAWGTVGVVERRNRRHAPARAVGGSGDADDGVNFVRADIVLPVIADAAEIGGEVEGGGKDHRLDRLEQARGNDCRDGVGGIVQPVQEIERQRDDDQPDEQGKGKLVHQA